MQPRSMETAMLKFLKSLFAAKKSAIVVHALPANVKDAGLVAVGAGMGAEKRNGF